MADMDFADNFLLLSKDLWRQGWLRTPSYCSSDTPHEDCMCSCPDDVLEGRDAAEVFKLAGFSNLTADSNWESALSTYGLSVEDLFDEICHVGSPGEMFTSSAPQDPTFWPLHGNAERFLQLMRELDYKGNITFDQTWSYYHTANIPSDDHLVCDWSGVDIHGVEKPNCYHDVCPGHKEEDLLSFTHLMKDQDHLYSNKEFYKMVDPRNTELPYVYDSLDYWSGCTDSSMWKEYETTYASKHGMPSSPNPAGMEWGSPMGRR